MKSKRPVPKSLQQVAYLSKLLDSSIRIPFSNISIGLEPILGLVPILGDSIGFIMSSYIMVILWRNNGSGKLLAKMSLNMMVDALLAVIPVLGNILDFFVKTNERNLKLALEYYEEDKHQGSAWAVIVPVVMLLLLMMGLMLVGVYYTFGYLYHLIF
ncbi:MAG: DUF4112 domain-containing protein [Chitinophagales bacterium]|nr:DUF4112 domain-containing protein [Chitinophagales bacterium]